MGISNVPTANDGTPIPASDHNSLVSALKDHFVPRNSSGNATDEAGGLGTALYRWANLFVTKITVGVANNLVTIEESASALLFKFNGVTGGRVTADGIDADTLEDGTLRFAAFATGHQPRFRMVAYNSDTSFTVPDECYGLMFRAYGGGGGGGGGAGHTTGGGGAGGNGAQPVNGFIYCEPGDTIAIVIGAGGAGGSAGVGAASGLSGSRGGTTTISRNGTVVLRVFGAFGGNGGTNGGSGGTVNSNTYDRGCDYILGGAGGQGNPATDGADGQDGLYSTGGANGTAGAQGGSGGGGGAGEGPGAAGGNGGFASSGAAGSPATANTGGGGGGGGGSSASGGSGGGGGTGGSGRVYIGFVKAA